MKTICNKCIHKDVCGKREKMLAYGYTGEDLDKLGFGCEKFRDVKNVLFITRTGEGANVPPPSPCNDCNRTENKYTCHCATWETWVKEQWREIRRMFGKDVTDDEGDDV